ncbi:MAG: hypothetical protein LR015_01285 [Verrucomicrobia bacterium]|nr:hypothetical protein [Verrucomicrobiota bacterium]
MIGFVEFYRRCLRPWIDRIEVRQADLTQFEYEQQPIEFLMLDVMKYEGLVKQVTPQFFPCLIPGKGVSVQPGLSAFYESWVHVIQYLLKDCFTPLTPVYGSGAFVFKCVKQVPLHLCLWDKPLAETWSDALLEEAFAYSHHICRDGLEFAAAAAHVMMYVHFNRLEQAKRLYRQYAPAFSDSHSFKELYDYCLHSLQINLKD